MVGRARRWPVVGNQRPIQFWRELVYVAGFYGVYTLIRDSIGSNPVRARVDALAEIGVEKWLGIYREEAIQRAALHHEGWISAANAFYGIAHFIVPIAVLVWTFFRFRDRYRGMRNALGWITAIALVVYACFPVMPPRLLPASYGFVDTIRKIGGLPHSVRFLMKEGGNAYAAMPSLHVAWAIWAAVVVALLARNIVVRTLAWAFPVSTTLVVLVTANHFFLDILAGVAVAWLGFAFALLQQLHGVRHEMNALSPVAVEAEPAAESIERGGLRER